MDSQIDSLGAALESVLRDMTTHHQEMLSLLRRKQDALRSGDESLMSELCTLENHKVRTISELEKRRLTLTARLTLLVEPQAAEPMRMADLTPRLPEPMRGRLTVLRQQLRQQMEAVREQTSIARRAADSLMRHVQGLVQTIGTLPGVAATYSNRGGLPQTGQGLSTINMTA